MTARSATLALVLLFPALPLLTACGLTGWLGPAVTAGEAPVPGGALHFEQSGDGSDVVLLHGGELDRRQWDDQFAAFAASHRVLRYDARGRGRSTGAHDPYRAHDDLLALLDARGVDRAHLVGLSLGARVAVDFALAHPERVASMVLASPSVSGWRFDADELGWMMPIFQAGLERDALGAAELWLASDYLAPAMADDDVAGRVRRMARDNAHVWITADLEVEAWPPARDRLDALRPPMLVIVGARDVPDTRRIGMALEARAADVVRVEWEGVGHLPNMERPDAFNALVLGFLARHDGRVGGP